MASIRLQTLWCVVPVALCGACWPVEARETVGLAYRPEVGQTREYGVAVQGDVRVQAGPPQRLDAEMTVRVRAMERVADPAVTRERVVLGPARVRLGGQLLPWTLGGEGYTAERDARGRLIAVPSRAPAMVPRTGDFVALLHDVGLGVVFPEGPVEVGDSWTVLIEDEPFIFEPQAQERQDRRVAGELRCTLTEHRLVAGVPVVGIEATLAAATESAAGRVSVEHTATLVVDVPTGTVLRGHGEMTLTMTSPEGSETVLEGVRISVRRIARAERQEEGTGTTEDTRDEAVALRAR